MTKEQHAVLKELRRVALDQQGASEAWYRFDNLLDGGSSLAQRRPAWGLHGSHRAGELVVTALASPPLAGPNQEHGNPLVRIPEAKLQLASEPHTVERWARGRALGSV